MNAGIYLISGSLLLGLGIFLAVSTHYADIARRLKSFYAAYTHRHKKLFDALFMRVEMKRFAVMHLSACALIPLAMYYLVGGVGIALLTAPLVYVAPKIHLARKEKQRKERLNVQIMDALGLIANALKAGLTLPQAFESVTQQMMPPISEELSLMLREYKLGLPIDGAMMNMSERVGTTNMELFISSIVSARRSGGDIAMVLEKMGESMKEIFRLEGKISALTSQGKAQGFVLGLLPFFLGVVLYFMDKNMIVPLLTTPQGYAICGVIALFWAIGIFFIWKIVNVEV